jgi:hypothetical protein
MWGRFTNRAKPEAIAAAFGLTEVPALRTRFNIAST